MSGYELKVVGLTHYGEDLTVQVVVTSIPEHLKEADSPERRSQISRALLEMTFVPRPGPNDTREQITKLALLIREVDPHDLAGALQLAEKLIAAGVVIVP